MKRKLLKWNEIIVRIAAFSAAALMAVMSIPAADALAAENEDGVKSMLAKMTMRQKITQCMMVDFRKWSNEAGEPEDMTVLNSEVADLIAEYQFGSVILFAENIKKTGDTVALTKAMQNAAMSKGGKPMIITTDQEGGIVYRLGSGTALPGNMALAATGDPGNAETAGYIIGKELDAVGINTTLAPVLDVNNNPNNPIIGIRSFSDDADMVIEYGNRYIAGLDKNNIIGCGKHFPGHGDTETDSHYGLPVVDKSLEELQKCELRPFEAACAQGIDMIMTAHILYPQIDDTKILSEKTGKEESRPATMSKKILTGLLRESIGYQGVVVTDAMNMQGVSDNYTMEQATLEALRAGADLVCMPVTGVYDKAEWIGRMESIISRIEQAAEDDPEFATQLDEAVMRILRLKQEKGILNYDPDRYTPERASAVVGCEENRSLEREIAAKAVTVIRNENDTLPLKVTQDSNILMLAPYDNEKASMAVGLNRAKAAGIVPKNAKVWLYRYSADDYEIKGELEKVLEWADVVIINSEIYGAARMTYEHWSSAGPKLYTDYCRENDKKSVVMSLEKPYDVQLYPNADAIIAVYNWKGSGMIGMPQLIYGEKTDDEDAFGPNIVAGVEVIFGVFGASGKLPVNIPEFDPVTKTYKSNIVYDRGYGLTYGKVDPARSPKKASIKTLTAGRKKLTVTMTASPAKMGGTKYQIAYRIKDSSKWSYKNTSSAKLTIKSLKKGKKYTVKVRAVRDGAVYGPWSKAKTSKKIK